MKYKIGQKVQDKRDLIRGRVIDYFEQKDPRYWIEDTRGLIYPFLESELELTPEAILLSFALRAWSFIKSDWLISAIIFGLGILGGLIL